MKISLTDISECIYCYIMNAFVTEDITSVCAYVYSGGATYWHM